MVASSNGFLFMKQYISNNSSSYELDKLISALGIRHIGSKAAKVLAKKYTNIDNLINASLEELTEIDDVGKIIAQSIKDFFSKSSNLALIEELKDLGLNMNYLGEEIVENDNFKGKTFVLTGTLETMTRDEAQEIIENNGGKTSSSVSKKTDGVIVGSNPGSKYDKAVELNIPVITEEEFKEML